MLCILNLEIPNLCQQRNQWERLGRDGNQENLQRVAGWQGQIQKGVNARDRVEYCWICECGGLENNQVSGLLRAKGKREYGKLSASHHTSRCTK